MQSKEQRAAASERMKAMHTAKREQKAEVETVSGELATAAVGVRSETERPRRNLFNGQNQRLVLDGEIPGYRLYWFNDRPGRIEQAIESGYEFVKKDEVRLSASRLPLEANAAMGDRIETITTNDATAGFQRSVLMKIREEFFAEDQNQMQEEINRKERQAVRSGGYGTVEGSYVPESHKTQGALQISHKVR